MSQLTDYFNLDDLTFQSLSEQANSAQHRGDHAEAIRLIDVLYRFADQRNMKREFDATTRAKLIHSDASAPQ